MSKKNQKIQEQIYEDKIDEDEIKEDEKVDMREFLKDMKGLHKRVQYADNVVQEQDKRLVGVNEKLDEYNKEVDHGEDLTDIVNKGVFGSIFSGIKNLFKSKGSNELKDKDKKIIKNAKEKEIKINEENDLNFKEDGEWSIIKKDKDIDYNKYNEDEIIDESIKEVKRMTNSVKHFNKSVQDSTKVVEATNKHFDKTSKHVKKAIKKMDEGL